MKHCFISIYMLKLKLYLLRIVYRYFQNLQLLHIIICYQSNYLITLSLSLVVEAFFIKKYSQLTDDKYVLILFDPDAKFCP